MPDYPRERLVPEGNTVSCGACWDDEQLVTWWPTLNEALDHLDAAHGDNPGPVLKVFVPAEDTFTLEGR